MVETDSLTLYWKQSLKNCKALMSDWVLGTDLRDRQMAENLVWIKENNPGKKIVCWGATSHFLYNQEKIHLKKFPYNVVDNYYQKTRMMGDYIKNEFGDKVYTVGFIAYEGKVGFYSRKKIKPATENSLEYVLAQSEVNNVFLPFQSLQLEGYQSRPLGNQFMKTNIQDVMDGVIFNRKMYPVNCDRNLYLEVYPTNRWLKPDTSNYMK